MAKKLSTKKKVSKDQLRSSIQNKFAKKTGGINAIIPPKDIDEKIATDRESVVKELSHSFAMLPISKIESNPGQPRKEFDKEALDELAASIKIHGLIQPITVRRLSPDEYQIISGERRWRASQLAGLKEVPVFIRIANDQTLLEMALIENIQREDLNPFEIAVTYYRLKEECALTDRDLAERVGKKRSTVSNYLRLLDLHIEVVDALKNGQLSMGHGRAIAGIQDKLLQKQVLDKIFDQKLSVRDTEKLVKEYSAQRKQKKVAKSKSSLEIAYQTVENDFRTFFGTKKLKIVIDDKETGSGKVILSFSNTEELNEYFKMVEQ